MICLGLLTSCQLTNEDTRSRAIIKMEIERTRRFRVAIVLQFATIIQVTVGVLVEEPENKAALLNETTILKCKSDNGKKLQWHLFGIGSKEVEIWSGYFLNPKACSCPCCKIDNSETGKYNLEITARKETAALFRCTEPGTLMRSSADVIVIESELNNTCTYTYNETTNVATLSCAIRFYGRWIPRVKWINNDGEQVNETSGNVENGKVTSTITILTKQLKRAEVNYTASVYFKESERPTEVTATNIPTYTDEWKSPPVKRMHTDSPVKVIAIVICLSLCLALGIIIISAALFVKIKSSRKKEYDNPPELEPCMNRRKPDEGSVPGEKIN